MTNEPKNPVNMKSQCPYFAKFVGKHSLWIWRTDIKTYFFQKLCKIK